jgi:hypothetical protein
MAKKKTVGRPPKPGGEGRPVRIAADVATMARRIADTQGIPLGDYVTGLLRATVTREYVRTMKELDAKGGEK